jgi:hypothetical protein
MKAVSVAHIIGGIVLLVLLSRSYFSNEFVQTYWWVFVLIGLGIAAYHASKFMKNTKRWIYLFHAAFVAPVILVLGIYPNIARQVLQLVACAMISYHAAILADIL